MDGSGTNKFFMKDGKEYYYPFEQYRFFEKTYTSAKDMFLNISNKTIVTQEGLPIFTLRDLSLEKREAMSIQEQSRHIQKLANLKTEPTGEEFGNYSKQIRRLLIQKLPPAEQREQIRIHDLMTDYRTIEKIKKDLPRFEEYLNGLPI